MSSAEISRLEMTGDQNTLDSSLAGGYLTKAGNYGPAIFKAIELVSFWDSQTNVLLRLTKSQPN